MFKEDYGREYKSFFLSRGGMLACEGLGVGMLGGVVGYEVLGLGGWLIVSFCWD